MSEHLLDRAFCAGFFTTVAAAERAVRDLLDAGFSTDQLAVIVPENLQHHFLSTVPREPPPSKGAPSQVATGAAIGATLGGIALVATAVTTGGASLIPGAIVLIGGGALAGGFSSFVLAQGSSGIFEPGFV